MARNIVLTKPLTKSVTGSLVGISGEYTTKIKISSDLFTIDLTTVETQWV
jgi:hypothetical protein